MTRLNVLSLVVLLYLTAMVTACTSEPEAPTSRPTSSPLASATVPSETPMATEPTAGQIGALSQLDKLDELATIAAQRTPMPTRAPGPIREAADDLATEVGLDKVNFLGLSVTVWIDLIISVLVIIFLVYIGLKLLIAVIRGITSRTKTTFDDEFVNYIERELRWFIMIVITAYVAVLRLDVFSDSTRLLLEDIFYLLGLGVLYLIILRLINFSSVWYRRKKLSVEQRKQLGPFVETVKRLGYLLVSTLALSALLSHFGVEVTMLSALVLFGAIVLFLGARAAVTDAISGFIILVSQPFRVNDTILVKELNTRGVVEEIGLRTTHLSTRDGREIIVPNSLIGASQVVNYSHPDPNFRVEVEFITNGGDFKEIEQIIEEAVRSVDGVLADQPVDTLYIAFGGTGRQLRVLWWVDDVNSQNRVRNRVNQALDLALSEAGIETPNLTYDLNVMKQVSNRQAFTPTLTNAGEEELLIEE